MSKKEKDLQRLLSGNNDNNFTRDELVTVLSRSGFVQVGGKSSHEVWRHPDSRKVTFAAHGQRIKPIYIKKAREELLKGTP